MVRRPFLHPTIVAPFNTAIVRGYNTLMRAEVKLGGGNNISPCDEGF